MEYQEDEERIIDRDTQICYLEFKQFFLKENPELDIDSILKKDIMKKQPVLSYGIIEFVKTGKFIYYHMFRKRHTIEYDTVIRGYAQKSMLFDILCLLSKDERERILNNDFDTIWDDYYVDRKGAYKSLKQQAQRRFNETKQLLQIINKHIPCKIIQRPLIFPKGKRDEGESEVEAALREAEEEIKVNFKKGKLYFSEPITKYYTGSDGQKYIDNYYVWQRDEIYKCPTQKLKGKLRKETIGHELESDTWIEIPIFSSQAKQLEWENGIDSFQKYGMFKRHFQTILDLHAKLI